MTKKLFYFSLFLFIISLFLPGLYSKPQRAAYEYSIACRNMQEENTPDRMSRRNGVEMVCFLEHKSSGVYANCTYDEQVIAAQRNTPGLTEIHGNALPCRANDAPTRQPAYGIWILAYGIFAVFLGVNFAWLANLTYLLAFAVRRNKNLALGISIFGFLLAFDTFRITNANDMEAGTVNGGIGIGFYFWLLSLLAQIAYLYLRRQEPEALAQQPQPSPVATPLPPETPIQ